MHALLALAVVLVAVLARDAHAGLLDYVLDEDFLAAHKNKAKLVTKLRPEDSLVADNVILESNVLNILKPSKRANGVELVRQRRGYNLEHVIVPARYPYLPAPRYRRYRRGG